MSNMGTKEINLTAGTTYTYSITSGADNVFVNGSKINCTSTTSWNFDVTLSSGGVAYYQIITQNGTNSPFVTLLKFTA